jgi:hypothetical protein
MSRIKTIIFHGYNKARSPNMFELPGAKSLKQTKEYRATFVVQIDGVPLVFAEEVTILDDFAACPCEHRI